MTEHTTADRAQWTAPQVKRIEAGSAEDGAGATPDAALPS
jgi:hypothetical protein